MSEAGLRSFYNAVRAAEGKPGNDPHWALLSQLIGLAWQRYEISDDDANALEQMMRALRFPRR